MNTLIKENDFKTIILESIDTNLRLFRIDNKNIRQYKYLCYRTYVLHNMTQIRDDIMSISYVIIVSHRFDQSWPLTYFVLSSSTNGRPLPPWPDRLRHVWCDWACPCPPGRPGCTWMWPLTLPCPWPWPGTSSHSYIHSLLTCTRSNSRRTTSATTKWHFQKKKKKKDEKKKEIKSWEEN